MTEHAILSPSAASRWMACPGSVQASQGVVDVPSEAALEGTRAHEAAAQCLMDGTNAADIVGDWSDEDRAAIQLYLDAVRGVMLMREDPRLLVEQTVYPWMTRDLFGTADAVLTSTRLSEEDRIDVFDFKFGRGIPVDPEDNPQAMIYALGVMEDTVWTADTKVLLHIVQPRCGRRDTLWRAWETTAEHLYNWKHGVLRPAVEAALEDNPKFHAGDHCRFCPHAPGCAVLRDAALKHAQNVFSDPDKLEVIDDPAGPEQLPPEEVARALNAIPVLETWISRIREYANHLASQGTPPPGYKLVRKVGNRRWRDEDAARVVLRNCGVDPYQPLKLLSPAQAEKQLPKSTHETLASLVSKPETGTVLVPDSDKRPAIDAASRFPKTTDQNDD